MSLFNASALNQQQRQTNQDWNHPNNYNHSTSGAYKEWSAVPQQLSQVPTSLAGGSNSYIQDASSQSLQGDAVVTDEPGVVIGREEVILTDQSSVPSSGYQSSSLQNHLNNSADIPTSYSHNLSLFTKMHDPTQLPSQGEFSNQCVSKMPHVQAEQLVPDQFNHTDMAMGHRLHQSYSQPQFIRQHFQGEQPYLSKQFPGHLQSQVRPRSLLYQTLGQRPTQIQHQLNNSHGQMQGMNQHHKPDSQQPFVSQLCFSQHNPLPTQLQVPPSQCHNQVQLPAHQQGLSVCSQSVAQQSQFTQSVNQQKGIGQLPIVQTKHLIRQEQSSGQQLGGGQSKLCQLFDDQTQIQQQMNCPQSLVGHQASLQSDQHSSQQSEPKKQLRLMKILKEPPVSLHNASSTAQISYGSSSNMQDQQLLSNAASLQSQAHFSLQTPMSLQSQLSLQPGFNQQQTFNHDSRQAQAQRISVDQQQVFSQQSKQQQNPDKELLVLVHPKPAVTSGGLYLSTQYESVNQYSAHISPKVTTVPAGSLQLCGSTAQTTLLSSAQQSLTQASSAQLAPTSSQLALQSPQLSVQSSPQVTLQSSSRLLPNSQIFMIHPPQLSVQNSSQISLHNGVQAGQFPQSSVIQVQSAPQAPQVQNVNQVVHLENSSHIVQNIFQVSLPDSTKIPFALSNVSPQQPLQICQTDSNQNGGNQLPHVQNHSALSDQQQIAGSRGAARGRQRGRRGGRGGAGQGGRGGGGGVGQGSVEADSLTGIPMLSQQFRMEPGYSSMSDPGCIEASTDNSITENSNCSQEQSIQEMNRLTPKPEQDNSSPLQRTELACIDNYSPPASSSVLRLSATNEVWPTPMPLVKQERPESPPALILESLSSCSQQSSDCPVFSPSSCNDDIKPSPPVPQVSAPQETVLPEAKPIISLPEPKLEMNAVKHKLADDEEGTAVCKYCGYCSSNFSVCEGCNRKLPDNVKVVVKKRKMDNSDSGSERERTCGGGKVNASPSNIGSPMSKKAGPQSMPFVGNVNKSPENGPVKSAGRPYTRRRGTGTGRGRGRKNKEPVTVTISSDEDEEQGSNQRLSNSSVTTPSTQDEEDGFFSTPLSKPNSTFGTSRRNKMLDASGQCVQQTPTSSALTSADGIYFHVRGVRIGTMRTSGLEVRFRKCNIGFRLLSDRSGQELDFKVFVTDVTGIKYSLNQSQPVAFIKVTPECGANLRAYLKMNPGCPEFFDPSSQDLKQNMIVVIIDSMINEKGFRHTLESYSHVQNLSNFLQELNFDEANHLLVQSSPPVLKGSHSDLTLQHFQQLTSSSLALAGGLNLGDQGDSCTSNEGQQEMKMQLATAGDASMDTWDSLQENKSSGTPSPKPRFVGPVEKLLTYPPAPAKGAITITNEDLFCLNDGEFLNDVILDFYLKYLFYEKLSEEDRRRTHVFSSFFYKRLTHRQGSQDHEANMTAAQKRHSRVKTWTRHVDIFSKDFLLIPINENSHWFLAIICFPGLESQEQIKYHPATPVRWDMGRSESTDSASPQQSENSLQQAGEGEQDSLPENPANTMSQVDPGLSKMVPTEEIKKGKSIYSVGLRQACILIMDSLMGPSRNNIIKILKEYLQVEWDLKKGTERKMAKTVRGGVPKVPQQNNYVDCGVFVLQYAESFFEQPIPSFSIPMKLEHWFPLSKVEKKRDEIRQLILRLGEESCR